MNKEHSKKWAQLETMLYDTPEKVKAPLTAKASSRLGLPKNNVFKFIRTTKVHENARSLNSLQIPQTPDKDKSISRFGFDSDSRGNLDSRNQIDDLKAAQPTKAPGSFNSINSIEDDLVEPMSSELRNKQVKESTFKRGRLQIQDTPHTVQTVIITSKSTKKKFTLKPESTSLNSLTQLEKQYKICEPICGINEEQFRVLFKKKCEDMEISGYTETEEKFISNIRKKSLGTKLCFPESGFGKNALEQLGSMLENNHQVSQLFLRKSYLASDNLMPKFLKSLQTMPNLVNLDLANNALESREFALLFKSLTCIQTLISIDISNYEPDKKNKMGQGGVEAFGSFVKNNQFLQFVTLSNLMLDDENTQLIIQSLSLCPNLLILDLKSNVFIGTCLEGLSDLFNNTTLIKLDLSNNKLKKEAATNLAKFIQSQRIDMNEESGRGVKDPKDTREGMELVLENTNLGYEINTILESLGRGSNIKKLIFSQNLMADLEITHFETALAENRKLQEIDLSNCKLGDIQGKMLALGLKKNKHLQSLVLGNNNLGDTAGSLIVYALIGNHSLRNLDLSQNKLGPETAKALQGLIKRNPNLHKYNLNYNNFDEQDGYLLQESLFFNDKIIQFSIAYNRVKFNTLEAVEGIIKGNQHKLQFAAVPKLRDEVEKRNQYISEEKHHVAMVGELDKKKEEINRDVKRFKETLTDLKGREKSPTSKKKERLVLKLSKNIKEEQPKLDEINNQIREFLQAAQLEKESYMGLIEKELQEVEKGEKRIKNKQEEIEKVRQKYEPDIKILKYELSKLNDEIRFMEMYNNTIVDKIKKEKQIITIQSNVMAPKVSDVFLATSELAKAKKKQQQQQESPEKPPHSGTKLSDQSEPSQAESEKVNKGLELVLKSRQSRADKLIGEVKKKEEAKEKKKFRRMGSKSDNSKQELMREKINEKISKMFKEDSNRMEPINEGEVKDN